MRKEFHKIVFIAPLSGVETGMSCAVRKLYDNIKNEYEIVKLDIAVGGGASAITKVLFYFKILSRAFYLSTQRWKHTLFYFTISESKIACLRDIILLLFFRKHLNNFYLHIHGGNGICELIKNNPFFRYLLSVTWGRCACVIVLAEVHAEVLRKYSVTDNVKVVPNFFDDDIDVAQTKVTKFSRDKKMHILYLSNFIKEKGYWDLLDAFRFIKDKGNFSVHLDLAGSFFSDLEKKMVLDFCTQHFPHDFTYHGFVQGAQKNKILQNSSIFCLPTYYKYEGQPISVIEAYAAGCVVLTTNHSGIPSIFVDNKNGFFVKKNNPLDIAGLLEKLYYDSDLIAKFSSFNATYAEAKFTSAIHVHNIRKALSI